MTRRGLLPLLAIAPFYYGCRSNTKERVWRGVLFNNPVRIRYQFERDLNDIITARVQELDSIFSLYDSNSEIALLNLTGSTTSPSKELLLLLEKCRLFHQISEGNFDPTIQSYWHWLSEQNRLGEATSEEERLRARAQVDFSKVQVETNRIALNGSQLTFNAVAQGFATDQVTELLARYRIDSALIDLGEYRALGGPFLVGIRHPSAPNRILESITLKNSSLAVSSGSGHRLSASGKDNHLLSPATGQSPPALQTVIVQAPDATTADAWATILSLKPGLADSLPEGVEVKVFS